MKKALSLTALLLLAASSGHAGLENGMEADVVLGQPDFTQSTANNGGVGANTFNWPGARVVSDGRRLFVTDFNNNRVLIWNTIPTSNFAPADVVVGQPNLVSNTANNGGIGASTISGAQNVFSDGRRLFSTDSNNRALIWNTIPTSNFAPADVVLGQPDFVSSAANNGGIGASTLNAPRGISSDGRRLFIVERENHRVLIWNTIPTANFTPADVVLGQPDFVSSTANNGGRGASTLFFPFGVFSDGRRLFVADTNNSRILIWNTIPTSNFTPADVVVGQPDFTQGALNNGGRGANTLNGAGGVFSDGQQLFVSDNGNSRILIWKSIPTSNFAPADVVLGQPDFVSGTANNGGIGASTLNNPFSVSSDGRRLFVGDLSNNRVLIFNVGAGASSKLGPQFTQGKALVGKVFWDLNGNGVQDESVNRESLIVDRNDTIHDPRSTTHDPRPTIPESGIEGIKVVSDTGIYAITDSDGKYHFPYIETGQRILKIDEITLPEGAKLTTESPRKILVTEGVLSKVSFGVTLDRTRSAGASAESGTTDGGSAPADQVRKAPLLKATITQDPVLLKPTLSVKAERQGDKIVFFIETNYAGFFEEGVLSLYDKEMKHTKEIPLKPVPYRYETEASPEFAAARLAVQSKDGRTDGTDVILLPEA